jgi:hypothetical protein
MPATSKEPISVPHSADAVVWPVEIAIVLEELGEPADDDWTPADWDGNDAVLLIGAGTSMELEPGEYVVWSRITTATQQPVRRSGTLTVGTP